jgi:ubiquinone biosynthesis protein UbiJ
MIWFDRQAARDLSATFALRVRLGRRAVSFGLHVDQGRLHVARGAPADAGAAVTMHAHDLLRLATGAVGWPQLLATGRLELTGDPFRALRFPGLFRLPSAPRRSRRRRHPRQAGDVDVPAL